MTPAAQAGVLSFRVRGRDCEELGEALGDAGIAVRAGLHCAPLAHRTAGTLETGTVRASVSAFNTDGEDTLLPFRPWRTPRSTAEHEPAAFCSGGQLGKNS